MTSEIDIAKLRELALAATPGPWVEQNLSNEFDSENQRGWWWVWRESALPYYGGVAEVEKECEHCTSWRRDGAIANASITDARDGDVERADAAFIAAVNPSVVLELLDRLEAAEKS